MTNKEKFNQLFEETFGVSSYSVFELECTAPDKCPHYNDPNFKCIQCEYDTRNFWNQEYKEKQTNTAEWIWENHPIDDYVVCSKCGWVEDVPRNYCAKCGARMKGEKDDL